MTATKQQYDRAFQLEQLVEYPVVDAYEARCGFAINRALLESYARVLACPVKKNPPNWQHGRVIYAALRQRIADQSTVKIMCLDIGTAKGFSALMMRAAVNDAGIFGSVVSVDVVDPEARVARNTVAEVYGLKTVAETLAQVTPTQDIIRFLQCTGADSMNALGDVRIHFAFIDGKHSYKAVSQEAELLAARQQPGDMAIFDDVHIEGVNFAVSGMVGYRVERLMLHAARGYAIATRV